MSPESEQVFSEVKHTISDQRCSLSSETIEILKCLKSWFRIGLFTEENLHKVTTLDDDEGLNQ